MEEFGGGGRAGHEDDDLAGQRHQSNDTKVGDVEGLGASVPKQVPGVLDNSIPPDTSWCHATGGSPDQTRGNGSAAPDAEQDDAAGEEQEGGEEEDAGEEQEGGEEEDAGEDADEAPPMLRWIKVGGRTYRVYNPDGTHRKAEGKEEMQNNAPSDWQDGEVWDDEEQQMYVLHHGELSIRPPPAPPNEGMQISPITVEPYQTTVKGQLMFGHVFRFVVSMKDASLIQWNERTNVPYIPHMPQGEWFDLYAFIKDGTSVFKDAKILRSGFMPYPFEDPPAADLVPNKDRTLEFHLVFRAGDGESIEVRAVQHLQTDGDGNIVDQSFTVTSVEQSGP